MRFIFRSCLFLPITLLPFVFTLSSTAATYSATLGVMKVTFVGGATNDPNFNLISSPFVPSALLRATVTATTANGTVTGAPDATDLTLGSADLSFLDPAVNYYLEVLSGSATGTVSNIDSVVGSVVTVVDDLSAADGSLVAIRETPTIGSVFGADNRFNMLDSDVGDIRFADQVWLTDPESGATTKYFYSTYSDDDFSPGWFDEEFNPSEGVLLYPEAGLLVRMVGPDVTVSFLGEVRETPGNVAVFPGYIPAAVFNPLSEVAGVPLSRKLTLGTSGLYTGDPATGVLASPVGDPDEADKVLVVDPDTGQTFQYYYSTLNDFGFVPGWLNQDFEASDDTVLKSGSSFYILRRGVQGFNWTQPIVHNP